MQLALVLWRSDASKLESGVSKGRKLEMQHLGSQDGACIDGVGHGRFVPANCEPELPVLVCLGLLLPIDAFLESENLSSATPDKDIGNQ